MTERSEFGERIDVSWQLNDTTMSGTLVKPNGAGPFSAVVMVAGSGPTDRDWTSRLLSGTNGSAPLIADELARAGFASLRYDKRASGQHPPEYWRALAGTFSMQSHTDELAAAVRTLAGQEFVRDDQIFGLGNSEGTLHVLNYQLSQPPIPFAGLILVAPPGRSVGDVARAQLAPQAALIPNGDALLALYDQAIARFVDGGSTSPDPALPQDVQTLLQSLDTPMNLPFSRELWTADAAGPLSRAECPVLVLIGKKDLQVDWQADGEILQQAAQGRSDVTFDYPESANHVLKHESRPRSELTLPDVMPRYNADESRLDPEAIADVLQWLSEQTGR
ncbi:MAG: alpha/beta hydrolase [Nitrolancea sp.]